MHFVDLDDDGDLDLFLEATAAAIACGAERRQRRVHVAPGTYPPTELHPELDFDEDGKIDLTMTYVDGGGQWWKNFSTPGTLDIRATDVTRDGNTARTQVLADFNRDGQIDWLRAAPPGIEIDFGDGIGGFAQDAYSITIPGTDSNENANFMPGDFDSDGDIDLLVWSAAATTTPTGARTSTATTASPAAAAFTIRPRRRACSAGSSSRASATSIWTARSTSSPSRTSLCRRSSTRTMATAPSRSKPTRFRVSAGR